jgi:hypothetical protein
MQPVPPGPLNLSPFQGPRACARFHSLPDSRCPVFHQMDSVRPCDERGLTEVTQGQPRGTGVQQASGGCPQKTVKSAKRVVRPLGYLDWGLPYFSSVMRRMPGYNLRGAQPATLNYGGHQLKWTPSPKPQRPSVKTAPPSLGLNPRDTTKFFWTGCLLGKPPHQQQQTLVWIVEAPATTEPRQRKQIPVLVIRLCLPFPAMRFVRRNCIT